jgi:two-component system sensor histidine kinase ChvG
VTRPRSRIALRIFLFNALLVFLPVAAFSLLGSYERGLVDSLERALSQQARITAAWLGQDSAAAGGTSGPRLDAALAKRALYSIGAKRTARFRVVDSGGYLLADSSDSGALAADVSAADSQTDGSDSVESSADTSVEPLLYRLFSAPARAWRRLFPPPVPPLASADFYASAGPRLLGGEIQDALAGSYGAATRVSSGGQVSVTLYSAVPVSAGGKVLGAVLVSQSTYRILRDLYAIRLDIAKIFLVSLTAAAALSLLLALTIVGPLKQLGEAAAAALGGAAAAAGEAAAAFPESRRTDEIGDLQRSLRSLVERLDERARQTERFAADAAHEFRNPLAAIRSAAELAERAGDGADRSRFHAAIIEDVDRLRSIIDGLRRLSLVEAQSSEGAARTEIDAIAAVRAACERERSRLARDGKAIAFEIEGPESLALRTDGAAFEVILDNLIGNAASFARSVVRVRVEIRGAGRDRVSGRETGRLLSFVLEDDGPGIPAEHLEKVFDRFFTWRPGEARGNHTGLGLSLALALAKSLGGDIEAGNASPGPGARFSLEVPCEA